MTDIIGRIEGMLWCNARLAVPMEVRQTVENCFEISFKTNREMPSLIAGVAVTVEDNGNVIVDYHGPHVDGTGSKILGNIFKGWERATLDDE